MEKFNYKNYTNNYPDLRFLSETNAFNHWLKFGKKENRTCNPFLNDYSKYCIKGYTDLLSDKIIFDKKIPKIIFKTSWHTRDNMHCSIKYALEITKNLNPNHEIYYFDNQEVEQFMKDYSEKAYSAWLKIKPSAFKCDLWRYCILEKYGGCYSDIGHVMNIPFNDIIGNFNFILTNGFLKEGIHNALICCCKSNSFIKKAIDICLNNIENNYYGENDIDITGPFMLSKINIPPNTKMLNHIVYVTKIDANIIVDNKKIVCFTKFKDYYKIMYESKQDYHILWKNGDIYNK